MYTFRWNKMKFGLQKGRKMERIPFQGIEKNQLVEMSWTWGCLMKLIAKSLRLEVHN